LTTVGYYDLGKMIYERIVSYADNNQQKDLSEIFHILIDIGMRTVYKEYSNVDDYLLYEAVNQIAEDVLLSIQRQPAHFIYGYDNFYPYYRFVLKSRVGKVISDFYEFRKNVVSLDEYDEDALFVEFTTPYDTLKRNDRYAFFVGKIYSKISASPRFKYKANYLLWPMIVSLFLEDRSALFNSLGFRDRVALRIMLSLVESEKFYTADVAEYL
jgi:hypothetical protein